MKLFFQIVGFPLRLVLGLVVVFAYAFIAIFDPNTAKEIPATLHWVITADAEWERQINPDPVLLFRYSALTYNSHRIHYDQIYATRQEFYPGVVVQGPLLATLLLELCQARLPDGAIRTFQFRAVRPTYLEQMVRLSGKQSGKEIALWSAQQGSLCMTATATLA